MPIQLKDGSTIAQIFLADGTQIATVHTKADGLIWTGGGDFAPVITQQPTISGGTGTGSVLTLNDGAANGQPAPTVTARSWYRDGVLIAGETGTTYTMLASDDGKVITARVNWNNTEGDTLSLPSNGITGTGDALSAPVVTADPTIAGGTTFGSVLTPTTGSATGNPAPTGESWQWYRDGAPVSTAATYTLAYPADNGATITVTETWTNSQGSATSSPSNGITAETYTAPVVTVAPTISGNTTLGSILTVTADGTATGNPNPTVASYAWFRDNVRIDGETASTYTTSYPADDDKVITARVNWTNAVSTTESGNSNAIVMESYTAPVVTVQPTIAGNGSTGSVLTISDNGTATGNPNPTVTGRQWYRNNAEISGETGATYTMLVTDENDDITVRVDWNNPVSTVRSGNSNIITGTGDSGIVNTTAPYSIGPAYTGDTLAVDDGTWSETPSVVTYQWKTVSGGNIAGATSNEYRLADSMADECVYCTVTADGVSADSNGKIVRHMSCGGNDRSYGTSGYAEQWWGPRHDYAGPTTGADYFVAPDGNDTTGDGSIGNPWLTPQHAADNVPTASGAQVVAFRGGSYSIQSTTDIDQNINGMLTFTRYGTEVVEMHGFSNETANLTQVTSGTKTARDNTLLGSTLADSGDVWRLEFDCTRFPNTTEGNAEDFNNGQHPKMLRPHDLGEEMHIAQGDFDDTRGDDHYKLYVKFEDTMVGVGANFTTHASGDYATITSTEFGNYTSDQLTNAEVIVWGQGNLTGYVPIVSASGNTISLADGHGFQPYAGDGRYRLVNIGGAGMDAGAWMYDLTPLTASTHAVYFRPKVNAAVMNIEIPTLAEAMFQCNGNGWFELNGVHARGVCKWEDFSGGNIIRCSTYLPSSPSFTNPINATNSWFESVFSAVGTPYGAIWVRRCHDGQISNCHFSHSSGGMVFPQATEDFVIQDCVFWETASAGARTYGAGYPGYENPNNRFLYRYNYFDKTGMGSHTNKSNDYEGQTYVVRYGNTYGPLSKGYVTWQEASYIAFLWEYITSARSGGVNSRNIQNQNTSSSRVPVYPHDLYFINVTCPPAFDDSSNAAAMIALGGPDTYNDERIRVMNCIGSGYVNDDDLAAGQLVKARNNINFKAGLFNYDDFATHANNAGHVEQTDQSTSNPDRVFVDAINGDFTLQTNGCAGYKCADASAEVAAVKAWLSGGTDTMTLNGSSVDMFLYDKEKELIGTWTDRNVGADKVAWTWTQLTAPTVTVAASISGDTDVGDTLTCTPGSADGNPAPTASYQWQNDGGIGSWSNIAAATNSTYVLQASDDGDQVRCVVTWTNSEGTDTSNSNAITCEDVFPPSVTASPTIAGSTDLGSVLTATTGTATGNPTPTSAWQWQYDDSGAGTNWQDLSGETNATYTTGAPVVAGDDVRVRQRWTNSEGTEDGFSNTIGVTAPAAFNANTSIRVGGDYNVSDMWLTTGNTNFAIAENSPYNHIVSCWIRLPQMKDNVDGRWLTVMDNAGSGTMRGYIRDFGEMVGDMRDTTTATIEPAGTAPNWVTQPGMWNHILHTSDGTNMQLWINDVKYIDGAMTSQGNFALDQFTIGGYGTTDASGGRLVNANDHRVDFAELYINWGESLDFDTESNRRKFISAQGTPVSLGSNGSTPTGNQPDFYFGNETSIDNWIVNKGSVSHTLVKTVGVLDAIEGQYNTVSASIPNAGARKLGTEDAYLSNTSNAGTGVTVNNTIMVSFWIYYDGDDYSDLSARLAFVLADPSGTGDWLVRTSFADSGQIVPTAYDSTGTSWGGLLSGASTLKKNDWTHCLIVASTSGSNNEYAIYLDGNTTPADTGTPGASLRDFKYSQVFTLSSQVTDIEIAQFTVWVDDYVDVSVPANMAKFCTADGHAVDFGLDGSLPTGTAPLVYYNGGGEGDEGFKKNRGTGGSDYDLDDKGTTNTVVNAFGPHYPPRFEFVPGGVTVGGNNGTDYKMLGTSARMETDDTSTDAMSMSFWMRADTSCATSGTILEVANGSTIQMGIQFAVTNELEVTTRDSANTAHSNVLTGNNSISADTWHHVQIYQDAVGLYVYIDGTLEGSDTTNGGTGSFSVDTLLIGSSDNDTIVDPIGNTNTVEIAELWFDMSVVDFSVQANRDLFVSGNAPKFLGTRGGKPTGSDPTFYIGNASNPYLSDYDDSIWNKGSGNLRPHNWGHYGDVEATGLTNTPISNA